MVREFVQLTDEMRLKFYRHMNEATRHYFQKQHEEDKQWTEEAGPQSVFEVDVEHRDGYFPTGPCCYLNHQSNQISIPEDFHKLFLSMKEAEKQRLG